MVNAGEPTRRLPRRPVPCLADQQRVNLRFVNTGELSTPLIRPVDSTRAVIVILMLVQHGTNRPTMIRMAHSANSPPIFLYPAPFPAKIFGCSLRNRCTCWGIRSENPRLVFVDSATGDG